MKNWGKKLFGISFLLFIIGVCGLVWLFSKQEYFAFSLKKVEQQQTIEQDFKAVDVSTGTADLVITPAKVEKATVRLVGEVAEMQKDRLQFTSEVRPDGTLVVYVQEKLRVSLFYIGNDDLKLEVTLPEKQYESIRLKTDTGNITSGALTARKADIASHTGDLELNGFAGERLDIQTDTGDMQLAGIRAAVTIDTATGDIDKLILPELTQNMTIRTDTGDVRMEVEKQPEKAQLELSTDTGTIEAGWQGMSYEEKDRYYMKGTLGTAGPKVYVKTSTGDIRIQ